MNLNDYALDGTDLNSWVNNYRQSLQDSYDAAQKNIENTRRTDNSIIMNNANIAGTMYSNFPQRDKYKYQTSNYLPNLTNAYNTYSTGIQKLRASNADLVNQIKAVQESLADLNNYGL